MGGIERHAHQPPEPGSLTGRWHARRQAWADRFPAMANLLAPPAHGHDHDPYQRPFYVRFRRFLEGCLRHRWWVLAGAGGISLASYVFVPLIGFNALYRWATGEGQTSASFILGRKTGGEKLAPFRLDMIDREFRALDKRPLPAALRH